MIIYDAHLSWPDIGLLLVLQTNEDPDAGIFP